MPDSKARLDQLARTLAFLGDRVTASRAALDAHGQSEAYYAATPPDLVVYPESTDDVRKIVVACAALAVPIIPYGAGTSLERNAAAIHGGVAVDFERMARVIEVHPEDMTCRVEPGVRRHALNQELRDTGLFFPIDPGADASIGGMSSTRGSGTMAVRYGTMRDIVMALEVVLADGRVIRTGRRARKSAAGYDLTRLFVGAEGTLGVITEITLKLSPQPEAITAAVCAFDNLESAIAAVTEMFQLGVPLARVEFLDEVMMRGVNAYSSLDYAERPTLFLEFHGSPAGVHEQAQIAETTCLTAGGLGFQWATKPEDRGKLWRARDNTLYAGKALRPGAQAVTTDVAVPISRLARCLSETKSDIEASGLIAPIVGHVGDGNFHVLILVDPANSEEVGRGKALHRRMVERAIALDGTCTGEHGIGAGKIGYLEAEHGADAVDVMRTLKLALDPGNIMNPGKIVAGLPLPDGASV